MLVITGLSNAAQGERQNTDTRPEREERKKADPVMALAEYQKKWDCTNDNGDYVLCTLERLWRGARDAGGATMGGDGTMLSCNFDFKKYSKITFECTPLRQGDTV